VRGTSARAPAFTVHVASELQMIRTVLAVSLTALGASCSSDPSAVAAPAEPAPTVVSEEIPAAPPASNAEPIIEAAAEAAPTDTLDTSTPTYLAFEEIMAKAAAEDVAARPYGEIVQWVGEQLLGRPYVAGMLDAPESETLVLDLTSFDCVLYVENVLSLARAIALGTPSYEAYADNVRSLRYRDGQLDGYCSRLHYFSDWIRDNERRGTVQNVTQAIGGRPFDKQITFMGEHRDAYPKLANDSTYACILRTEADLAGAELFYVPQDRIGRAYDSIHPGDIIATATSIGGLDVTHTGFVHKTAAHTGFMHASLASNEVKISDDLQSYVQGIRSQVGVVVVRPVDPRTEAPAGG